MSAEVKEHHVLAVLPDKVTSQKKRRKKKKKKIDWLKNQKKDHENDPGSQSHSTIVSCLSISSINKSLVFILVVLLLSHTTWLYVRDDVYKNIDHVTLKANVMLNNSNVFEHIQKLSKFINKSKLFMMKNDLMRKHHNYLQPPHSNGMVLDCCKRRPYCLDKCWWGRKDYTVLTAEKYLQNQLTQSCCKTNDGGIPLDLTLKNRIFSRTPNGFFIESGGQDGVFQSNTLVAEKIFGWRGLLIEPSKQLIDTCKQIREPQSKCIHAALVEPGAPKFVSGPKGSPVCSYLQSMYSLSLFPRVMHIQNKATNPPLSNRLEKLRAQMKMST
jgi:hypothetical protein